MKKREKKNLANKVQLDIIESSNHLVMASMSCSKHESWKIK